LIRFAIFILLMAVVFSSCREKKLFHKLSSSYSGIEFSNNITESDSVNVIDIENVYNGGGVGIADFNNDGLPDIYFTGNMVSNKLYLNRGNLKFEDITAIAGVAGEGKWSRGVSIVDINNDGLQDIYISATILKDSVKRENMLYINQGLNKEGIPVFKNMAAEYGLNDNSYTTQAAFFDYDNDGDLDVYLAVNVLGPRENANAFRRKWLNGEHPSTGRLYRNDWDSTKGHPVFTNVSRQAGILQEGYSHSVTIADINQDGWKDIYITNDYLTENILYINNGNGTFTNQSGNYFKHTAYNAMGADIVDINNDGLSDVIELDMNPEDNYRKKTMLNGGNYQSYLYNNDYNYQYQYIRNNLQLNMGPSIESADSLSHPVFTDISFYNGIAETDWSWTPLAADFDNDGFRDILVTNGFPKDVTDHDFMAYRNGAFAMNDKKKLLSMMPEVKIPNYVFKNNGDLTFKNNTVQWGLDQPTFSNGAVAVDLDNDGDLDIVINNINDKALVYENTLNRRNDIPHHYLKVLLKGSSPNKGAFGSWIKLYYDHGKQQVYETNPVRGYLSSLPNDIHFGMGNTTMIDSVVIIWPDKKTEFLLNVKTDQEIIINQNHATGHFLFQTPSVAAGTWLKEISDSLKIKYIHSENDFNDFGIQRLLPHKFTQSGPSITVGDINKDGLEDFVVASSAGRSEEIFIQQQNGSFYQSELLNSKQAISKKNNDAGILLFDANGDGYLDLYICSGGYEEPAGSETYQDKLYMNDGKGNFLLNEKALPLNHNSKSCVKAIDFDKDGDLDLFIGERVEPWQYPKPVSGMILRNDSKNGQVHFTDVTKQVAPGLENVGLICDALSVDYNNDGWPDLVLAGEWMPITFFVNHNGVFVNETPNTGLGDKIGWWNCLYAGDFDQDGKIDFIAGNLGQNSFFKGDKEHPLNIYYNDFDKNGTYESITTRFIKGKNDTLEEYETSSRDEVLDQLPFLKKRTLSYKSFAEKSFKDRFTRDELKGVLHLQANYFLTSYIHNLGNGKFEMHALPPPAQFGPVEGIVIRDFNKDGKLDIALNGNDFGAEVFNGRMDGLNGLILKGDGKKVGARGRLGEDVDAGERVRHDKRLDGERGDDLASGENV